MADIELLHARDRRFNPLLRNISGVTLADVVVLVDGVERDRRAELADDGRIMVGRAYDVRGTRVEELVTATWEREGAQGTASWRVAVYDR